MKYHPHSAEQILIQILLEKGCDTPTPQSVKNAKAGKRLSSVDDPELGVDEDEEEGTSDQKPRNLSHNVIQERSSNLLLRSYVRRMLNELGALEMGDGGQFGAPHIDHTPSTPEVPDNIGAGWLTIKNPQKMMGTVKDMVVASSWGTPEYFVKQLSSKYGGKNAALAAATLGKVGWFGMVESLWTDPIAEAMGSAIVAARDNGDFSKAEGFKGSLADFNNWKDIPSNQKYAGFFTKVKKNVGTLEAFFKQNTDAFHFGRRLFPPQMTQNV